MPVFRCPTRADQDITYIENSGSSAATEQPSDLRTHYMGVMGASSGCPNTSTTWPDSTYTMLKDRLTGQPAVASGGGVATNGVITIGVAVDPVNGKYVPANIRMKDITNRSAIRSWSEKLPGMSGLNAFGPSVRRPEKRLAIYPAITIRRKMFAIR